MQQEINKSKHEKGLRMCISAE